MKCKVCGGTGTSNTCVNGTFKPCTFCDGTGECEPFDLDVELDKLYPPEQTNEEWLRQATTEQLAEKLTDFSFWLVVELPTNERREKVRNKLLEWLKQPHTTKE